MQPVKVQNLDRIQTSYFQLIAYICDACNYNCQCCYNEKPRSNKFLDLNMLFDYIKFLQSSLTTPIEINFLGGEPTLHPDLISFCKKLSLLHNVSLIIYSNASQDLSYYNYILKLNNIRVDLSYHTINGKRNADYVNKIVKLTKNNYSSEKINITLMLENQNAFNDIKKINDIFMKMHIHNKYNIDYRLIRNFNDIDDMSYYSNEELDYFRNNYIDFAKTKIFEVEFDDNTKKQFSIEEFDINTFCKFNKWHCNAGKETLYCHCNGDVYNCQSHYIENKLPLFNLYNEFSKPSIKSIICNCKNCRIDCEVTKWK